MTTTVSSGITYNTGNRNRMMFPLKENVQSVVQSAETLRRIDTDVFELGEPSVYRYQRHLHRVVLLEKVVHS